MEELELDIFPGDFGLPSLDRECLLTLAYCRFAGVPLKVHHKTNLYSGKVPALRTSNDTIVGADNIIDYLERRNYRTADVSDANPSQTKLDLWSYKALIQKKLDPCLQFFWWYDLDNYNQFLRSWYARQLPFPTNFFIPNSMRKEAVAKLESQFSTKVIECENKATTIEQEVTQEARYCLNLLMQKIGSQNYFFGDKPTSFDALVFSYLALLLKVPTRKSVIQSHISLCEPLKNYVDRVLKSYFAQDATKSSSSPFGNSETGNNGGDSFSTIKWRDVAFSGVFAGLLMVFYAAANGLVKFSSDEEGEEYNSEEQSSLPEQNQQE